MLLSGISFDCITYSSLPPVSTELSASSRSSSNPLAQPATKGVLLARLQPWDQLTLQQPTPHRQQVGQPTTQKVVPKNMRDKEQTDTM